MFLVPINMFLAMIPLTMKTSGHTSVELILTLFRKPLNSPPNGESQPHHIAYEKTSQV